MSNEYIYIDNLSSRCVTYYTLYIFLYILIVNVEFSHQFNVIELSFGAIGDFQKRFRLAFNIAGHFLKNITLNLDLLPPWGGLIL